MHTTRKEFNADLRFCDESEITILLVLKNYDDIKLLLNFEKPYNKWATHDIIINCVMKYIGVNKINVKCK